jgi:hypothetical protein
MLKIHLENFSELKEKKILDNNYYNNIKNNFFNQVDVEIYHVDKGKDSEYFWVDIPFSQIDKLEEYTDIFLEQIVTPFFKKLNTLK